MLSNGDPTTEATGRYLGVEGFFLDSLNLESSWVNAYCLECYQQTIINSALFQDVLFKKNNEFINNMIEYEQSATLSELQNKL